MATTTRRSRASRAADKAEANHQPNLTAVPSETPKPQPEKPTASLDLGARKIEYFFPSVTINGETFSCSHSRYGHESEASAKRCASALASQHGGKLG